MFLSIVWVVLGLALVLFFSEQLVKAVGGLAAGLGISAFLLSVFFLGFDPENLSVGAVGSFEGASGIALGSIIGAAMVAIALAFGITALIVPMRFEQVPKAILVAPLLATVILALLAVDGRLSRWDGVILLVSYGVAVAYLFWLARQGIDIQAESGEVAEEFEEAKGLGTAKAFGLLVISLIAVVGGSELLVMGARDLIEEFSLSETAIGMTIIALLVSIEELARELPAALKGRPEISYGNVNGSILAFFLFNAGVIALVSPVEVDPLTLQFYLPIALATIVVLSFFLLNKRLSRLAGAILVVIYAVFAIGGYLW